MMRRLFFFFPAFGKEKRKKQIEMREPQLPPREGGREVPQRHWNSDGGRRRSTYPGSPPNASLNLNLNLPRAQAPEPPPLSHGEAPREPSTCVSEDARRRDGARDSQRGQTDERDFCAKNIERERVSGRPGSPIHERQDGGGVAQRLSSFYTGRHVSTRSTPRVFIDRFFQY